MQMFIYNLKKFIGKATAQMGDFFNETLLLVESQKLIRELLASMPPERLERSGFKAYSQNDEDGIIAEIFQRIGAKAKTFVEFGVGDGTENNTAFLLRQGWSGLWLEGCQGFCENIRKLYKDCLADGSLTLRNAFIDKDNINVLISSRFSGEIDLLSIDIDGNDYHVLKAISCVKPRVIVAEYNAKYPPPAKWVFPYDKNYCWDGSSDNQGMSLESACELASGMSYQLVATNITGSNAFFVRNDLLSRDGKDLFPYERTTAKLYNPARFYLKLTGGHRPGKCVRTAEAL